MTDSVSRGPDGGQVAVIIVDGTMVQHVHLARSTICNCMYTSYSEKMKDTGWVQGICCTCSLHDKQRNQNIRRHLHAVLVVAMFKAVSEHLASLASPVAYHLGTRRYLGHFACLCCHSPSQLMRQPARLPQKPQLGALHVPFGIATAGKAFSPAVLSWSIATRRERLQAEGTVGYDTAVRCRLGSPIRPDVASL